MFDCSLFCQENLVNDIFIYICILPFQLINSFVVDFYVKTNNFLSDLSMNNEINVVLVQRILRSLGYHL